MTFSIAWERASDGGVDVISLPPGSPLAEDPTAAEVFLRGEMAKTQTLAGHAPAPGKPAVLSASADLLPRSKRFRNAWRLRAGKVEPDLDAARGLLEGEIAFRPRASQAKLARVRAGIQGAGSVDELETLAGREGWKTAVTASKPQQQGLPAPEDGEDF